ncbi:hypothetical protein [Roseibium sediminicola]|uniref:GIY-YIG domain-containing protein n=1 Tax=Roseibium sediminicola TaxID=2933272 RepID=A0ABT0GR66_9HYPH|nr:hypothetical protein [Roseibium sp. CAU 1639]MCK7611941.1 hypothetical protein [Roseibium sp. CAU 1639]
MFEISSKFTWPHQGKIQFDDRGRPCFPRVQTKAPGVYLLRLDGQVYVGETAEANGLNGRWNNYRRYRDDKPPTYTNNRINRLLVVAAQAGSASVSWITSDDPEIVIEGVGYDLSDKGQRKAIEGFLRVVEGAGLNL